MASPEARAFQSAIDTLNSCDGFGFLSHLSPEAEIVILPTSLGLAPLVTRKELVQHVVERVGEHKSFSEPFFMRIIRIWETKERNPTIVVQAESSGKSEAGTLWCNEYFMIVEFSASENNELPKIKKMT
ncbi:hypothetical protein CYLTODRAFT_489503 [Cylindrobasidium torrendii FP15055 ss-10]|uniref:SnoaL-like domain-containing protein n=1 Tax=Cylindrobasidium torrendii FP15055 ss-10 TaxID=1314674 RepID=A0A0D7BF08_9AGAR|nr:hypothetical protein CYLTODRAFT_489503 [Cylindrobasidium torrendii FP15055 ss-10]